MNELLNNIAPSEIEKFQLLQQLFRDKTKDTRQVTLKEFYDEYVSYAEFNLSKKSLISIKQSFKHLLSFFSPVRPLDTIKLIDVEKFVRKIQAGAPRGYRVYYRTLKAAFNRAKLWDYATVNEFEKIKLPKVQKVKEDYLSADDVKLIIDKVENDLIKNVILFAFNSGMRLAEIVFLRWNEVDLGKRVITVGSNQFVTKSKKVRFIPINDTVYQLLLRIKATDKQSKKYVFGKTASMHFTTDYFSKKFKEAYRKTGINTDYCFHSLRHGFASRLAQLGVPIITISKLLGHSNISTTMIYSQVNLDDLRRAIDKLN